MIIKVDWMFDIEVTIPCLLDLNQFYSRFRAAKPIIQLLQPIRTSGLIFRAKKKTRTLAAMVS